MDHTVYLASCPDYTPDTLRQAVDDAFDALSFSDLVFPGAKVLVKPNLLMKSKPDDAVITHPNVVAAVAEKIKELGGMVTIADSPGGLYNPTVLKNIYAASGYTEMANKYGVTLNLDCSYQDFTVPNGKRSKLFSVITPVLQADLIVDIAKLKSHCMTGMSGTVKNIFGVVPGLMKPELHCRFPDKAHFGEMLADLCQAVAPSICFVDAVTAMEGNGPSGGKPRFVGTLAAGTNPFAVDVVCAHLMAMDPSRIFMLRSGMERGICPEHLSQVKVLGTPLSDLAVPDFLAPESKPTNFLNHVPKILRPLATKITTPIPKIRERDCIGCGKCAESCPQHTIAINQHKARIAYRECIRCYCCHEMCPVQAIDIKRFRLFNL